MAINGSPRPQGNSTHLLQHFMEGARQNTPNLKEIRSHKLNLQHCSGCLRCNVLKRCSISEDDWQALSADILEADILVFASPIYFHHLPAPLKSIIDRFRSFVHVQITETGLIHTPWQEWKKDFVLLLSMGSPDHAEANSLIELFEFMTSIMGENNRLHVITATRLAVVNQLVKKKDDLRSLYEKLKLPVGLAEKDTKRNRVILAECQRLGAELSVK